MKKVFILFIIFLMFFFKNSAMANYDKVLYDFQLTSISGEKIDLADYKNKAFLLVNTASFLWFYKNNMKIYKICGKYESKGLIVLGFPSNSFNQESNNDNEVKEFCEVNFNINFPLSTIINVKGENAHEIFKWAKKNYGNSAVPKWNFHKILINKQGKIHKTFNSFTKPTSKKIT